MSEAGLVAIVVAVIAAVPATLAAVATWSVRRRVGTPNGSGDLVQMVQRLIDSQAGQDRRLAHLEEHVFGPSG